MKRKYLLKSAQSKQKKGIQMKKHARRIIGVVMIIMLLGLSVPLLGAAKAAPKVGVSSSAELQELAIGKPFGEI